MKSRKRSCLACALVFVSLPVGFVALFWWAWNRIDVGENVASVDWLPPEATRVCWYMDAFLQVMEFDIPEKEFLAWARNPDGAQRRKIPELVPVDPAAGPGPGLARGPVRVTRYVRFLDAKKRRSSGLPPEVPDDLKNPTLQPITEEEKAWGEGLRGEPWGRGVRFDVTPLRGWQYEYVQQNAGGVWVVYDSDTGRAYYFYAHH